jgi:pSer/pThr/pTyr-binding forkhead associated (FHA) protein
VRIDDLADEYESLGRQRFIERYGKHFLVFTDPNLVEDAAFFVNTATRDANEITSGRLAQKLDVRPLVNAPHNRDTSRIMLGRDKRSDIAVHHPRVSAVHAVFTRGGGLISVSDAGSKNGTFVNGVQLKPGVPTPVDAGDTLAFGPVTATLWGVEDVLATLSQM